MNLGDRQLNIASLLALPCEPAAEFQDWRPGRSNDPQVAFQTAGKCSDLGEPDLRFLRAVLSHPGKPSSAYAKLSGLGTHQAIKARQRLTDAGYLREHRMSTGVRGRSSVVLEPLVTARSFEQFLKKDH